MRQTDINEASNYCKCWRSSWKEIYFLPSHCKIVLFYIL